jgi:DnaK suppressor protein
MKTVAKKAVKKAPSKAVAKVAVKVVAKKTVKPTKTIAKAVSKTATKVAPKAAVKKSVKAPMKAVKKPASKLVLKPAAKTATKPAAKPTPKAAVKKPLKPAKTAAKAPVKAKAAKAGKAAKTVQAPAKKVAAKAKVVVDKAKLVKPAKQAKPTKPTNEESKSKQSMIVASKTTPQETKIDSKDLAPAAPVLSKARTSRLASLTVPSMAQSIASTAAKSSYGPAVHAAVLVIPPPIAIKQNPKLANNWKTKTAEEMSDAELLAMPDTEYMNIKQMTYFRLKLVQLKQGILESAGATTEHLRDDSAVVPDPTDRATIEEEHALELRTRDRERKLLKKIEQSIARIDAGDYGYCDETGEAIGVGRLLARPTATLSLEAQQRRELKQKMFGD